MSSAASARDAALAVRPAWLSECAQLAALASAVLPEAWSEAQLSSEIALPEGRVWIARREGGLIGFLVARRELDELHILLTGVAPRARRSGAASRLFEALLSHERGLARVHLEVREGNLGALAFYRTLGLEPVGRRPRHYPDGDTAVLMSRTLEPRG